MNEDKTIYGFTEDWKPIYGKRLNKDLRLELFEEENMGFFERIKRLLNSKKK